MSTRARRLTRAVAASLLSGLFLGVAGRVAMRFVALEAGTTVGFSPGGSLEVVAFGAIVGAPIAFAFFAIRSRVPLWPPWAGVGCGLFLLAALGAVPPPAARSALAATPDTPVATALAFGAAFVAWGVALEYLGRYTQPSGPSPAHHRLTSRGSRRSLSRGGRQGESAVEPASEV